MLAALIILALTDVTGMGRISKNSIRDFSVVLPFFFTYVYITMSGAGNN